MRKTPALQLEAELLEELKDICFPTSTVGLTDLEVADSLFLFGDKCMINLQVVCTDTTIFKSLYLVGFKFITELERWHLVCSQHG